MRRAIITFISALLILALVVGSLAVFSPKETFSHSDKALHLIAYLSICFWHAIVFTRQHLRVFITFFALGLFLEVLQGLMGYRDASVIDQVANTVGCAMGITIAKITGINLSARGQAAT